MAVTATPVYIHEITGRQVWRYDDGVTIFETEADDEASAITLIEASVARVEIMLNPQPGPPPDLKGTGSMGALLNTLVSKNIISQQDADIIKGATAATADTGEITVP